MFDSLEKWGSGWCIIVYVLDSYFWNLPFSFRSRQSVGAHQTLEPLILWNPSIFHCWLTLDQEKPIIYQLDKKDTSFRDEEGHCCNLWFSNNVQRANAMGLKLRLCTLLIKWARNSLWCSIVIISGFKGEKPAFFATKYIKTF